MRLRFRAARVSKRFLAFEHSVRNRRNLGRESPEVFEKLVREHQSMVFSIALRFLRDRALAEELAQDVFLQLFEKLPELESGDHIKFWLRRATCHRAIDESRRRKHRPKTSLDEIREPAARMVENDPFMSEILRKLVVALPEKARAIVLMRYQEDLEPTEIAKVLNMPASSVKSLLHRSLKLLRGKVTTRMEART
jgi:RNA polymerase sigma-70 factor, ECF subfamily